jgi:hypothetical protein
LKLDAFFKIDDVKSKITSVDNANEADYATFNGKVLTMCNVQMGQYRKDILYSILRQRNPLGTQILQI